MSTTCSVLNNQTKEPSIFYRADNGEIVRELNQVLEKSNSNYETGFVTPDDTFISIATTPIFSPNTIEGTIQNSIKNGYLTGEQVSPNTFRATDNVAADTIHQDLLLNHYGEFRRVGNDFEFGDFSGTPRTDLPSQTKIGLEAVQDYTELTLDLSPKPINYNEDQLKSMISSFMERIGFSFTSIESYKERYKNKFGIEPDAKALIDLQEKIIATTNGEITLDELSEEFSHFVIESWEQSEIERMLTTVNNTTEYIENVENYRKIYSQQIQDPVQLENAVRREVLGKMLATALQKDFNTNNRSETEVNFFQRLVDIVGRVLDFVKSRFNTDLQNDLDIMAREINNRLYNDNLEKSLTNNYDPVLKVMYSVDKDTDERIKKLVKKSDFVSTSDTEIQLDNYLNSIISTSAASNDALTKLKDDEVIPVSLSYTIEVVQNMTETVEDVMAKYRAIDKDPKQVAKIAAAQGISEVEAEKRLITYRKNLIDKATTAITLLAELRGNYRNRRNTGDISAVIGKMAKKYTNLNDNQINEISSAVKKVQEDTSLFYSNFGHLGKASNNFVAMVARIFARMQNMYTNNLKEDIDTLLAPLIPHREKLQDFVNKGFIRSGRNGRLIEKQKREYELSILKEVYPGVYGNHDLEKYTEEYNTNGFIPELKVEDVNFYKYTYLYDEGISKQPFVDAKKREIEEERQRKIVRMNLGSEPWTNEWYKRQIARRKQGYNFQSLVQRRKDSSPYDDAGELKKGFVSKFYGDVKNTPNFFTVSTNPRHTLFGGLNEPKDRDIVFIYDGSTANTEGELAYQYLKWDSMNLSKDRDIATMKDNFKQAFEDHLRYLRKVHAAPEDLNKAMREWLQNSLLFEPTDEYWKGDVGGIDFDGLQSGRLTPEDAIEMLKLEKAYKELSLQKRLILKKYKTQNDYKEVDAESISFNDKQAIYEIDKKLSDLVYHSEEGFVVGNVSYDVSISKLFEKYTVPLYKEVQSNSTLRLNQSFREIFRNYISKDFDDASMKEIDLFFSNAENFNPEKYGSYNRLKTDLHRGVNSNTVEIYKDIALEMGMDPDSNEDVQKAYLISQAPTWFKRYDANEQYDNFLRDYNNGSVDVVQLVEDYLNSANSSIVYNGAPIPMLQITPSFRFINEIEPNINNLYEDYKSETDNKKKFEILQRMGGIKDVDPSLVEDVSDITSSPENLRIYMMMMDVHLRRLEKDDKMQQRYIYMLNQVRENTYERLAEFAKRKDRKTQAADWATELLAFRPDDYEDSHRTHTIPRYGYYLLPEDEITTDVFYSLASGLSTANLAQQRELHKNDALDMMFALQSQEFKDGKRAINTNYHKMIKEAIDYNMYGKTTSAKIELTVPFTDGKRVDLSKTLFGLKTLGVINALALSPIVAATNLMSGITQFLMGATVNRNFHRNSSQRAAGMLTKMLGSRGVFKDVGAFTPEAKINKIMYSFGIYDFAERFKNARYSRMMRLLPETMFSLMSTTNFPMQAQTTLTKLMEHRLVNGKFISWRQFAIDYKSNNPTATNKEVRAKFDTYGNQSMYDFMDAEGNYDIEALEKAGYTGDITKDKDIVMTEIRYITELTTMEIAKHHEGYAARDPRWGFVLSLKKWLVLATSNVMSKRRVDFEGGGQEEGLFYGTKSVLTLLKQVAKDKQSLREAWNNMDEIEQKNVRTTMVSLAFLSFLYATTVLLKQAADDDDDKDKNYLLQLASYMMLRNLNETFTANVGIGQAYFEAIQNPVMLVDSFRNMTNIVKFGDIGEEITRGKYKGQDKYVANILKATFLKNPYTISNTNALTETRNSYFFFNSQESLYHIFDLVPEEKDEE